MDGFFALFFSGFPDLLLIAGLTPLCGFSATFISHRILPGAALSVFFGNLFYAWQARRLAITAGRNDVTAVPFGINTPTIFSYIFLIMAPVFKATHDPDLAWKAGLFASLVSGIVQTIGAFCTDWLRRTTPLAALLCPIAGIAIAYLGLGFIFQIFQDPLVALVPAVIIFATYASRLRLPFRFPPALLCILVGLVLIAGFRALHLYPVPASMAFVKPEFCPPRPVNLLELLHRKEGWGFLSVILPMSVLDTIVSLQVLESVRLAGDNFPTRPSLLCNGLATILASFFGSAFPTSLYFGHMSHKAVGARTGYSIVNGFVFMVVCVSGTVDLVLHYVPLVLVGAIVIWFGLITVSQAFQEVPKNHGIAVAFGLLPLLAAWTLQQIDSSLRVAGSSLLEAAPRFGSDIAIFGLIAISQGALFVSMIWSASLAYFIDRRFLAAAAWMIVGCLLSCLGIVHGYSLTVHGVENHLGWFSAPAFATAYLTSSAVLVVLHFYSKSQACARAEIAQS